VAKNFEKLIFGGLHEKHAVQCNVEFGYQLNICSLLDRRLSGSENS
jgi:hypothetical protein